MSAHTTETFRRTAAEINLDHLGDNWSVIQKIAGDERFICPMVKANAYGHGAVEVSQALGDVGAKAFGVCLIEEGLQLREAGISSEILVFGGFDKPGAAKITEYQLTPVVSSWAQIKALEAEADTTVKVHLKFNTGMSRLGFEATDAEKLSDYFKKTKLLKLKALLTHLAISEDSAETDGMTSRQLNSFMKIEDFFSSHSLFSHVFNSGAIIALGSLQQAENNNHLLMKRKWGFRPGLMLYGYQPLMEIQNKNLKPVMTFKTAVESIRVLSEGETVSYGAKWKASKKSYIATLPVGYADGLSRLLSNQGYVLIKGERAPIVGTVCMDYIMVDVTALVESKKIDTTHEEEVILFGYDEQNNFLSAEEYAKHMQTISYEVLTSVGYRVPRHFKGLMKS
ncbi:MAG: alanine racemase [Pseudobdellovibrio sp.]